MVAPLDISVLVTQLPHLQKMQNAEQFHPEMMQTQLSKHALEKQIKERGQVPKTEKSEAVPKVREDRERHGQSRGGGHQDKHRETSEEDPPEDHSTGAGQIIDISV